MPYSASQAFTNCPRRHQRHDRCTYDIFEAASGYFGLGLAAARAIIEEVAIVTATWKDTAKEVGARPAEIARMSSAFEYDDLKRGLAP